MKNSKRQDKIVNEKKGPKKIDYSLTDPLKVMKKPALKLHPRQPLWEYQRRFFSCDVCLPIAVPQVQIIADKRVVQTGESFRIKVIGSSSVGLRAIWWFGRGTGIVEFDKAHWHELAGEIFHEEIWEDVIINQPGLYTFGANSRDTLYGVELGVPHQASEGAGISECIVEVRDDISYDEQVNIVKAKFGKTAAWETWMKSAEIRGRYEIAWERSRTVPTTLKLAFRYGGAPLAYNPPWADEHQHMEVLDEMATLAFPGLNFEFLYGADPATTDMLIEVGGLGGISRAGGNQGYLYYETIFGHEFGHILNIPHHYPGADTSTQIFMPPGEDKCVMARNSNQYCTGCKAAMHLNLDVDTSAGLAVITGDIMSRYPY
jgi:hypothetical protein